MYIFIILEFNSRLAFQTSIFLEDERNFKKIIMEYFDNFEILIIQQKSTYKDLLYIVFVYFKSQLP